MGKDLKIGSDDISYKDLVNLFSNVKLLGLKQYDVGKLLCDPIYIKSRSSQELTIKRLIVRFISLIFKRTYKIETTKVSNEKSVYFLFTGDAFSRKDYLEDFNNVTELVENKNVIFVDYQKSVLSVRNIFKLPVLLLWLYQTREIDIKLILKIDLMISLYRSVSERNNVTKLIDISDCKLFISFCDQWLIDSSVIQFLNTKNIPTATLQHGIGEIFFFGSTSTYFLCNGDYTRRQALAYGMKGNFVIPTGFMKLLGKDRIKKVIHTNNGHFGVVLDGDIVFENNLKLIDIANKISEIYNLKYFVKFHPSSNTSMYYDYLNENNIYFAGYNQLLEDFLKNSDFILVCYSTLFLELTNMLKPIFRFVSNPTLDYYPSITWNRFSNMNEFIDLYKMYKLNENVYDAELIKCSELLFGKGDISLNYQKFFNEFN